jgi:thioesterase domain-containing protein
MAADYLKEIRALQPEGPYFLGGFSLGGLVAFEMAQQLRQQGQAVALLVLIDPTSPNNGQSLPPVSLSALHSLLNPTSVRDKIYHHFRHLGLLRPQGKLGCFLEGVKGRLREKQQRLARMSNMLACQVYLGIGWRLPPALRDFYFVEAGQQAARKYVPQVYPGRVIFFQAANRSLAFQLDWGRLAGDGWEIHEVASSHLDIVREPHVQVLAKHLVASLYKAQAESSVTSRFTSEVAKSTQAFRCL